MKKIIIGGLLGFVVLFIFECNKKYDPYLRSSDMNISQIDGIKYESGNWSHPDYSKHFSSFGNHRYKIKVEKSAEAVYVKIPWRRADENPENKGIIIINAKDKSKVDDVLIKEINNESGIIIFKPQQSGTYYVYYLPHESTGGYYPKLKYLPQSKPSSSTWFKKYTQMEISNLEKLPRADIITAQSIDDFHSFFPMEIIASKDEVEKMINKNQKEYYLFPEFRKYPVKMTKYLPKHWIDRGIKTGISDKVKKGEFYTFQIGIYSSSVNLSDIKVSYSDLTSKKGDKIPRASIHSFNTAGIDLNGQAFTKTLNVKSGTVQSIWFGIDIPENLNKGKYCGQFTIRPKDKSAQSIFLELDVADMKIVNHGDDQPENMSRLRWLNSRIGTDKDFIAKPFIPVKIKNHSMNILGREIILGKDGLPEKMNSYFAPEMTHIISDSEPILKSAIEFKIIGKDKTIEKWTSGAYAIEQMHKSEANWIVTNESEKFLLKIYGSLEYDGTLNYKMELISKEDQEVSDISLDIRMDEDAAKFMVGLGRKGGKRPDDFSWKWDVNFHQEGVWMGNVNKGLQYVLRDENYERPLNTNFYHNKPLNLPKSWGNKGIGGIRIQKKKDHILAHNFSGKRSIKKGDIFYYSIRFLITPFKTIDVKKHFSTRFVHKYVPVEEAEKLGGTVINVHHANEINPYINYPFYNLELQKTYINKAHKKGIKVKLYNTIRELSYKAFELFPIRSLGNEIFNDGKGGGHSWLQEHLRSNYHSAWHATRVNDAAILNKGTSRWTNYYIEGLNWLAKNQKIDGLYLDDIAFSRETMKRIITVLSKHRDDIVIDLHSANQYNERDGFINSVFLYMEHLPYVSRLWFGEYFDYNEDPDYWITEVSGIPFGLTGEMLEKGGNSYRGMVFGMTTRVYGDYNPGALWELFDSFDIKNSKMLGYWLKNLPVKTSDENIPATIYLHSDRILIALGSWSDVDKKVNLDIDWEALGFNKDNVTLFSPRIAELQEKKEFDPELPIKIEKNKGLILILKKGSDN